MLNRNFTFYFSTICLLLFAQISIAAEKPIQPAKVKLGRATSFEEDIFPIFEANCLACHSQTKKEGSLVLEDYKSLMKGGDSGAAIVPGQPDKSYLYQVSARLEESFMPPLPNKAAAKALTSKQLGTLRLWIQEGAKSTGKAIERKISWQPIPATVHPIYSVALSPWARYAAAGRANRVVMYDLVSGKIAGQLNDPALSTLKNGDKPFYPLGAAHRDFVHSIAFSSDGNTIATGGYRVIKLWQKSAGAVTKKITLPTEAISMTTNTAQTTLAVATKGNGLSLWKIADGKKLSDIKGHTGDVLAMAFSPDGKKLATSSVDQHLRVWNVSDGKVLSSLKTSALTNGLTFSKDGSQIITANADNIIRIWSSTLPQPKPVAPKPVAELKGHTKAVKSISLVLPAGTQLVSCSDDGTAKHWDIKGKRLLRTFNHAAAVTDVAISPDGKSIATVSSNGTGKIWQLNNGKMLVEFKGDLSKKRAAVVAVEEQVITKQQATLADVAQKAAEKSVKDREAESKKRTEEEVTAKKTLPAAKKLSDDAAAKLKVVQAEQAKVIADHKKKGTDALAKANAGKATADKAVTAANALNTSLAAANAKAIAAATAAVTNANKQLATANALKIEGDKAAAQKKKTAAVALAQTSIKTANKNLGTTKAKQTADNRKSQAAIKQAKALLAKANAAITAANRLVAAKPNTSAVDRKVTAAEKEAKKQHDAFKIAERRIVSAARAIKVSAATLVKIKLQLEERKKEKIAADAVSKQRVQTVTEANKQVAVLTPFKNVIFSKDGKQIVTSDNTNSIRTWSALNGNSLQVYSGHTAAISSLAFISEATIVSAAADKTVQLRSNQPTWNLVARLGAIADNPLEVKGSPIISRALCLDFSPDGKQLAVGTGDPSRSGVILIWDLATKKVIKTIPEAHSDTVLGLKFSHDGTKLVSGGADKFAKIFDVTSGKPLKSFEGHTHHVLDVSWKADGSRIVSCGADNVIKTWNVETGEQVRTIKGYAKQVTSIIYIGTGDNILSGGGDKTVRMHLGSNGRALRTFSGSTDYVYSVAASRDETRVVAGGEDGILRVWDGKKGTLLNSFNPPQPPQHASAGK